MWLSSLVTAALAFSALPWADGPAHGALFIHGWINVKAMISRGMTRRAVCLCVLYCDTAQKERRAKIFKSIKERRAKIFTSIRFLKVAKIFKSITDIFGTPISSDSTHTLTFFQSVTLWLYPRFSEHSESDRNLGIPFRIRSDARPTWRDARR